MRSQLDHPSFNQATRELRALVRHTLMHLDTQLTLIPLLRTTDASAFSALPHRALARSGSALSMTTAPPGYKPSFDGSFKKAGEFLDQYVLEMDNGNHRRHVHGACGFVL